MKKILPLSLSGLVAVTLWMPITSVTAAGTSIEQRLQRLERMTENPVLLQLSRRLGEQQREIQELHDDIDRLKRDLRNANHKSDKRYKETDDRLSVLESGLAVSVQSPSAVIPKLELPVQSTEAQPVNPVPTVSVPVSALPTSASENSLATSGATPKKVVVVESDEKTVPGSTLEPGITDVNLNAHSQLQEGQEPIESPVNGIVMGPIKTFPATGLEKAKYQKAFALMKASKYDDATNAFEKFLSAYPKSELASNSAYWAGEGHLIKKQNQAALDSFMAVIERYPDSSKMADAQLRAADSLAKLNRISDAKKMYQNVINGRPHSRAAQTASKRLNGLK